MPDVDAYAAAVSGRALDLKCRGGYSETYRPGTLPSATTSTSGYLEYDLLPYSSNPTFVWSSPTIWAGGNRAYSTGYFIAQSQTAWGTPQRPVWEAHGPRNVYYWTYDVALPLAWGGIDGIFKIFPLYRIDFNRDIRRPAPTFPPTPEMLIHVADQVALRTVYVRTEDKHGNSSLPLSEAVQNSMIDGDRDEPVRRGTRTFANHDAVILEAVNPDNGTINARIRARINDPSSGEVQLGDSDGGNAAYYSLGFYEESQVAIGTHGQTTDSSGRLITTTIYESINPVSAADVLRIRYDPDPPLITVPSSNFADDHLQPGTSLSDPFFRSSIESGAGTSTLYDFYGRMTDNSSTRIELDDDGNSVEYQTIEMICRWNERHVIEEYISISKFPLDNFKVVEIADTGRQKWQTLTLIKQPRTE